MSSDDGPAPAPAGRAVELSLDSVTELRLANESRERSLALRRETPMRAPGEPPARHGEASLRAVGDAIARARGLLDEREHWVRELHGRLDAARSLADDLRGRSVLAAPRVPVAIVVPTHNALTELQACFAALVRNTTVPARLVFVDDASTDARVVRALLDWEGFAGVEVLRNDENQGFSATVNRAMRATAGYDVVVLNSDTAVTPHWLERLISTAYTHPLVATVTPLSDNAGAFSVPRIGESNAVPAFLDYDDAGRVVAQRGQMLHPRTPTANGFCMYIKRAVIDQIGPFDAAAFPRGYGEENDFCMRALGAGWKHVVDDKVFVHHVREASFGPEKHRLIDVGRATVDRRHPGYTGLVRKFVDGGDMSEVRSGVERAYAATRDAYGRSPESRHEVRPRVLYVAHAGRGGTPATTLDLMLGLESEYDTWLLDSTGSELRLDRVVLGERTSVERFKLTEPLRGRDFSRTDYRERVAEILDRYAFELVHVRHLFKHTFDLPVVAAVRGIPVVVSFHDYYLACPTVNLLDDRQAYCAGVCTPGGGSCRVAPANLQDLPSLKHRFVYEWRAEVQQMLAGVDAFVTTSAHTREVHLNALPALEGRRFALIEHGRDLDGAAAAVAPHPGGPVRIVVPGNLDVHKGGEFMRALLACDVSGRIQLHLMGDVPAAYADLGRNHGVYRREEFAGRVARVRPAFVGIFATWAETYCHTLSEAWAAGVPVVASHLGALRERIERHGAGWLVDPEDPAAAVATILAVADDPDRYARGLSQATVRNVRTVAEMSGDYSALYREVIDRRRTFTPRRRRDGRRQLGHGILRAEVVLPGYDGNYPGSTHVRLLRRLHHPSIRRKLHATTCHGAEMSAIPPNRDLVIVQRTAIGPAQVDRFLGLVAARGVPLVLDLDDDLFALGIDDPEYGDQLASLERLLAAADLVTVSTPALERLVAERGAKTLLVENLVDERLFFAGPATATAPRRTSPDGPAQVLYMGSPTHERDLAQLEAVFASIPAELTVVGRFAPGHEADWYRAMPVPAGHGGYPDFVRWLSAQRAEWDLAVAPLADTAFNRSKSDLKFLEYAALGLPGVFSRLEPYAALRDGVTALLVDNEPDAWRAAITALGDDEPRRTRMAAAALDYVRGERLIRHGADALLSALFDLVEAGRAPAPRARAPVSIERTASRA